MRKERFFRMLQLAKIMKAKGGTKIDRWVKLFWFMSGYNQGGLDEKYRTKS